MVKGLTLFLTTIAFSFSVATENVESKLRALRSQGEKEGWTFEIEDNDAVRHPIEAITGLIRPKNWEDLAPFVKPQTREALPNRFDWRERNVLNPVKNQGSCGSCWAFGTVAVLESAIKIKTGKDVSISEQQLVSCSPSYGSCGGGYFALGFYKNKGANYLEDFPYVARNVRCKSGAPQHEKVGTWAYVGAKGRAPTTEEIKSAIYHNGPVAVTVSASGAFSAYRSGIYNACNTRNTNHIVTLVGWDDESESWIMRNSWGKKWGEEGYMRIKYRGSAGKCNRIGQSAVTLLSLPE